jgi:hypothetical protein
MIHSEPRPPLGRGQGKYEAFVRDARRDARIGSEERYDGLAPEREWGNSAMKASRESWMFSA